MKEQFTPGYHLTYIPKGEVGEISKTHILSLVHMDIANSKALSGFMVLVWRYRELYRNNPF